MRKTCIENVLSDFGIVRSNVFKTQRKETKHKQKRTYKEKTELKRE